MLKINAKNLVVLILSGVILVGITGVVNAQQTLPDFETAVKLEPGTYEGGSLDNKEAECFYITGVESGQKINIKATFFAADVNIGSWAFLTLYDESGKKLAEEEEGFYDEPLSLTISRIHKGKDSDKYYIEAKCDLFEIASYTLEISLEEGEEDIPPAGGAVSTGEDEEVSEKGLNWFLILGIIAAIVVVIIIAYFFLKKKK